MKKFKSSTIHKSQGAILVVSLILLMVMTLIAVSAIDTSNLQSKMARNSLFSRSLYQKSLSEIEAQFAKLNNVDYLQKIIKGDPLPQHDNDPGIDFSNESTETFMTDDPFSQTVSISYTGDGPPPSGYSLDLYIGKNLEINSVSKVLGTGSISDQTQGLNYPAPKSN